jgi:hypothetical protein
MIRGVCTDDTAFETTAKQLGAMLTKLQSRVSGALVQQYTSGYDPSMENAEPTPGMVVLEHLRTVIEALKVAQQYHLLYCMFDICHDSR